MINVYDFDNTLYRGESTFDFFLFCLKKHPKLLKFAFVSVVYLIKYKMCLVSEQGLMNLCTQYIGKYLEVCPDTDELVTEFWDKHRNRLKPFYKDLHREDDVVISASFGFMLRPIIEEMGIKRLLCSEVNLETGEIERLCFRKNKNDIFAEAFKDENIECFYTDSLNDISMMLMAKKAYIVKGEKIVEYVPSQKELDREKVKS